MRNWHPRTARLSRTGFAVAVSAALIATVAACGSGAGSTEATSSSGPSGQTLDDLYQAAKKAGETQIMVYGPQEKQWAPVYAAFNKEFPGIELKSDFLFGADLANRIDQEQATGQYVGDMVHIDDVLRYAAAGNTLKFVPSSAKGLGDEYLPFSGGAATPSVGIYGMAYNSAKVKLDSAPSGWNALLDPQWAGRIGMANPTTLSGTSTVLAAGLKSGILSSGYLTKLKAQNPKIFASTSQLTNALATAQVDVTPVYPYSFVLSAKATGAPIGMVFPVEGGTYLADNPYSILNGAPHPNAAKLLLSWLFTANGQASIAGVGDYPVMKGAPRPEGLPAMGDLKLIPQGDPKTRISDKTAGVEEMKKIFG